MENTTSSPKMKKKKAKGPLRLEAIIPIFVIFALIYAYFFFFFDNHARRAGEYVLTQIHGAEVNIGNFKTSFWNASMAIEKIQITDKNQPQRDLFRVGEIRFKMLWDALLRAKVVIDDASILNIQALVPREKPGRVLPPPPPNETSALAKVQNEILDQTKEKFKDNFLGDIASVLGGVDYKDQLKSIEGDLKSSLRLQELDKALKEKRAEWDARFKALPQNKDIKEVETRIKSLNWKEKDPVKFAQTLNAANDIIKDVKAKVKQVDDTQKDLRGDVGSYSKLVSELEGFIKQDLEDLQKKFNIPKIDPKEFSQQLFMKEVEKRLVSVRKYVEVARKYMPPKRSADEKAQRKEEQLLPRKRGEGTNFRFPVTTGYPLFWLKNAQISSELGQSELSGNISGQIIDVTSNPVELGRPTRINILGDFPKQQILGLDMKAIIDHTTELAKESVEIKLAQFPVGQMKLADSKDVKLAINDSFGALQMNGEMSGGQVALNTRSQYNQVKYEIDAKSSMVKEILSSVFAAIPMITLNADITGRWDKLSFNINSNLGEELSKGFRKQLEMKLKEAEQRLRAELDKVIGTEKAKLEQEVAKFTKDLESSLGVKKAELDKALKDAENQVKGESNKLVPKEDLKKLENEGKKILKGIFGN